MKGSWGKRWWHLKTQKSSKIWAIYPKGQSSNHFPDPQEGFYPVSDSAWTPRQTSGKVCFRCRFQKVSIWYHGVGILADDRGSMWQRLFSIAGFPEAQRYTFQKPSSTDLLLPALRKSFIYSLQNCTYWEPSTQSITLWRTLQTPAITMPRDLYRPQNSCVLREQK